MTNMTRRLELDTCLVNLRNPLSIKINKTACFCQNGASHMCETMSFLSWEGFAQTPKR